MSKAGGERTVARCPGFLFADGPLGPCDALFVRRSMHNASASPDSMATIVRSNGLSRMARWKWGMASCWRPAQQRTQPLMV